MTDHALRLLRQDRRLAERAASPFDFDLDRALLTAADAVLGELSENAARSVRELAEQTAARVREVA